MHKLPAHTNTTPEQARRETHHPPLHPPRKVCVQLRMQDNLHHAQLLRIASQIKAPQIDQTTICYVTATRTLIIIICLCSRISSVGVYECVYDFIICFVTG
jgi:hypothetical protein